MEYFSPGTMFAETTVLPIDAWDIDLAVNMARQIKERHSATPYGFRFLTRSRGDADLDNKVVAKSPMYFLGGKIFTLEDIEARNDPGEEILRSIMRINGYERVVVNDNSWRRAQPLEDDDVVLEIAL